MFNMLNARLPRMQCPDGCGECCGMVSCGAWEGRKIAAYIVREGITPLRQGTTCPFFQDKHCAIYPVRPVMCRLYGHVDNPLMTCPHGYNVNIKPRLVDRIHREYTNHSKGPFAMIHALVYSKEEVDALWKEAVADITAAAKELEAPEEKLPSSLIMVPAIPPEAAAQSSPEDNSDGGPDGETNGQN